jgi:putative sigma-54 modulation protein
MKFKITSKGLKITDGIRNNIGNQIGKIFHGLNEVMSIQVFLNIEKNRHIADATVACKGVTIHATDVTHDLYMSIDGVLKKIQKNLQKTKDRTHDLEIKEELASKSIFCAQGEIL